MALHNKIKKYLDYGGAISKEKFSENSNSKGK